MAKREFTHDELLTEMLYDSATGFFWWKKRGRARQMNKPVGTPLYQEGKTYWVVGFCGAIHQAHRLAWFYVHAEWPPSGMLVDHINGHSFDNRIDNLRLATPMQNSANLRGGQCFPHGVTGHGKRWFAMCSSKSRTERVGPFTTELQAKMVFRHHHVTTYGEFSPFWSDYYGNLSSLDEMAARLWFPRTDYPECLQMPEGY